MKKLFLGFSAILALVFLTACQGSQVNNNSAEELTATLTVKFEDKTDTQKVTFKKGDTVLDVLKNYHKVEEENGMVTAIDGVSQDAAKNTYWMYDINDELAPKGVKEMTVAQEDKIVFYLETFK